MTTQQAEIIAALTSEVEKEGAHARPEAVQTLKTFVEAVSILQEIEHAEKTNARNLAFLDRIEANKNQSKPWPKVAADLGLKSSDIPAPLVEPDHYPALDPAASVAQAEQVAPASDAVLPIDQDFDETAAK